MSVIISGAVGLKIIYYNNIKFILFSDTHGSYTGLCDYDCKKAPEIDEEISQCYTIDGVIAKIIQKANNTGKYVDVYLEAPFLDKSLLKLPSRTFFQSYMVPGPLNDTIQQFYPCLYERNMCLYENARFHFTNIRGLLNELSPTITILKDIGLTMDKLLNNLIIDQFTKLTDKLNVHISFFGLAFVMSVFLNDKHLGKTNLWVYYMLCIESDDFINDFKKNFERLLIFPSEYIESTTQLLAAVYETNPDKIRGYLSKYANEIVDRIYLTCLHPTLITNKFGLIIHKLRAQLLGLQIQGDFERSKSIKSFFIEKLYSINISAMIENFNKFNNERISYLNTTKVNESVLRSTVSPIHRSIIPNIEGRLMDIYTLARMFRKYPLSSRNKNKSMDYHIPPDCIIVYAGKKHIDDISEYLTSQGSIIEVYDPIVGYQRCIEINSLFL
jgi:hypothetical protein